MAYLDGQYTADSQVFLGTDAWPTSMANPQITVQSEAALYEEVAQTSHFPADTELAFAHVSLWL